ncbi:DUF979 domain-containing protein [Chiayiivirga flava]|uniref:Putative membrane protein n=1 Tax=Chiayiivirga flava TaxID=659595 RepID=A0A7W8D2N3_9GAMM|nr:DUF979 domain-containing protein [Chiayiivirga flava]MBB5206699.1 putative membrane protein [Chiayiivirga flava]
MISLQYVYWLLGGYLAWLALLGLRDRGNPRRWSTGGFWALVSLVLLVGEHLPSALVGAIVIALALLAGLGGVRLGRYREATPAQKTAEARRLGNRLFLPALLIPAITIAIVLGQSYLWGAYATPFDPQHLTLVALAIACVIAVLAACALTRQTPGEAVEQSRRLLDAIGWAAILPLLLATLGSVFAASGVGEAVAALVTAGIPVDNRFVVVLAYALGMAGFTMIMGNGFAAFPVMTAGIGLPLLVQLHGADPAPLAAIGMLCGYCGTLMTPMAANFNLVPAALLELKDPYAVIRAQVGTALPLLGANVLLMYFLVFR